MDVGDDLERDARGEPDPGSGGAGGGLEVGHEPADHPHREREDAGQERGRERREEDRDRGDGDDLEPRQHDGLGDAAGHAGALPDEHHDHRDGEHADEDAEHDGHAEVLADDELPPADRLAHDGVDRPALDLGVEQEHAEEDRGE